MAGRTRLRQQFIQILPHLLAGDLHQTQTGPTHHLHLGPVLAHTRFQLIGHQLAVMLLGHVDEINDNHAAHIPQPQQPGNLFGCFHIRLKHSLLQIHRTRILAGIYVDNRQCLCRVHHQIGTVLQPDLAPESQLHLLLNAVMLEYGFSAGVHLDPALQLGSHRFDQNTDLHGRLAVVNHKLLH
ncbi:hypothetical protein D3C71_1701170 [compost metagenome]